MGIKRWRTRAWSRTEKTSVVREYEISPVTGLQWSRGFQEVKVPRFHNNGTGRW